MCHRYLTLPVLTSLTVATAFTLISCHYGHSQQNPPKADSISSGSGTEDYSWSVPITWKNEGFTFPPSFAPSLTYPGVAELRFTPGWGNASSPEFWSYIELWWLRGNVPFSETALKTKLEKYYTGLSKSGNPARATVTQVPDTDKDEQTYTATIQTFDNFTTMADISLHLRIHIKKCGSSDSHTAVLLEISPAPYSADVWKALDKTVGSFQCSK